MHRATTALATLGLATLATVSGARAQMRYVSVEPGRPAPGVEVQVRVMNGVAFAGREEPAGAPDGIEVELVQYEAAIV